MKPKNRSLLIDIVRITFGVLLILLGIAGLLLPILPGLILIFAGLFLLGEKKLKELMIKTFKRIKD